VTPAATASARVVSAAAHQKLSAPSAAAKRSAAVPSAEWNARFRASDDYAEFIRSAISAAMNGDGRAAWYIQRALSSCAYVVHAYRGSADPEAQLQQELQSMPNAPQWARNDSEKKTRRCLGLAQTAPFASLPKREGGYPSAYWGAKALAAGDPLAQEQAAADAIATISTAKDMAETEKTKQLQLVETDLRNAIQTGDPDALYYAGSLLANGRYSSNPLDGVAVSLAACDLGHDCSAANPDNPWANCKVNGSCPADADYAYYMQQSLGPETYAHVYSRAQEIEQAIRSGDFDTVLANLKIDIQH
jgi:hypothetical protein